MPRKKICTDVSVDKPPHNLFRASRISALNASKEFVRIYEEEFQWIEEILAESKKTFAEKNLSLLPKTPSAKRTRKKNVCVAEVDVFEDEPPRKRSKSVCESDDEVILNTPPQRTYRTRAASRANSSQPRKSARTNKKQGRKVTNTTAEKEKAVPSPVLSIVCFKDGNLPKDVSNDKENATPTNVGKASHISVSPTKNSKTHYFSPPTGKAVRGHVKNKVTAYEDYIEAISPSAQLSKSGTSVHSGGKNENIPETPDLNVNSPDTPSTVIKKVKANSNESCAETPTNDMNINKSNNVRRSIRKSITKSLKCTLSANKLNRKSLIQAVKHKLSISATENQQTPKKKPARTRLRLKKKDKDTTSSSESLSSPTKAVSSQSSDSVGNNDVKVHSTNSIDNEKLKLSTENIDKHNKNSSDSSCLATNKAKKSEPLQDKHITNSQETEEVMETSTVVDEVEKSSAEHLLEKSTELKTSTTGNTDRKGEVKEAESDADNDDDEVVLITEVNPQTCTEATEKGTEEESMAGSSSEKREAGEKVEETLPASNESKSQTEVTCESASSSDTESESVKQTTRTKQRKHTVSTSAKSGSESEREEQSVRQSTRTKQRKPQNNSVVSESENDKDTQPVRQSTRTKTRTKKTSVPSVSSDRDSMETEAIRRSKRTKQRKNTDNVSSVTESEDDNNERDSGHYSMGKKSRSTRSKMRKPSDNPSVGSDNSETEEVFAVPGNPPPKSTRTKTRKRQIDESSDTEAETSMSKRHRNLDQEELPSSREVTESPVSQSSDVEVLTEDDSSGVSDNETPDRCPSNKIVRPQAASFLHNLNNKVVRPGNLITAGVKTFVHQNTPPQKLTVKEQQEQKKKELLEKQKKEKERLQKRDQMLKLRIEEQRRKREERMQKAADLRELREKETKLLKEKLAKKMEVKSKQADDLKEEKLREDQERQRIRLKKIQEAEERRKQEEDEKYRKMKAQEEEEQRIKEMMQRKKEFEEDERLKKILEDRRRQEERLAELEKERIAEKERLRKLEEERERERQRNREEREKAFARERAERERQEAEKKRLKDLELKMRIEKLKEMEKKRLQEEEKRRHELKVREESIKQILHMHTGFAASKTMNTSQTNNSVLPRPNLNTTQTLEHNPDSYEMTPAKKYKTPSVDNYDISDLKSDDSTDEDDMPKKRIPPWASGPNLKAALINQYYHPPKLDDLFDPIQPPDLNELFVKKKARFNKRTSSAHWDSPILKPGMVHH